MVPRSVAPAQGDDENREASIFVDRRLSMGPRGLPDP